MSSGVALSHLLSLTDPFSLPRIIALMLGRLRMSVEESIKSYNHLINQVFGAKASVQSRTSKLEDTLKDLIKKNEERQQDELMMDPLPAGKACKTYVVSESYVTQRLSY